MEIYNCRPQPFKINVRPRYGTPKWTKCVAGKRFFVQKHCAMAQNAKHYMQNVEMLCSKFSAV